MAGSKPRANVQGLETPPPLARTERERAFFEFEQALICASEAFYRFAGSIFGTTGAKEKLSGQECVILQQLMVTPKSRSEHAKKGAWPRHASPRAQRDQSERRAKARSLRAGRSTN